jgi:hypothetical protein
VPESVFVEGRLRWRVGFARSRWGTHYQARINGRATLRKQDHTDHCRTTQPHAGQWFKNGRGLPGVFVMALGVVAVMSSDAGAAFRSPAWAVWMGIAAIAALSVGAGWLLVEGRRIGRVEAQWLVAHPDGPTLGCPDPACCRYFAKFNHPKGHSSFCTAGEDAVPNLDGRPGPLLLYLLPV